MIIKGEILKHQRESMGLSQRSLADGICHQSLISRMESESHITSMVILQELCHRLQIDLDQIVSLEEPNYLNLNAVRSALNVGNYGIARQLLKKQCNIKHLPDEAKPLFHTLHAQLDLSARNFFGALNDLQSASVAVTPLQRNLILEIEMVTTEVWLKLKDCDKARYSNSIALKKLRNFQGIKHSVLDNNIIVGIYRQSAQLELEQKSLVVAEKFLRQAREYASKVTLTAELVRLNLVEGRLKKLQNEKIESCKAYIRAYTGAEQLGDTVMMDDIKPFLAEHKIDYFD